MGIVCRRQTKLLCGSSYSWVFSQWDSIMLFCLISAPCMATVAVTWRESGSFYWALLQFAGLTVLAYILTTAVYQVGVRAGIGI